MANVMVGIPEELIDQLGQSALASLDEPERVRVALAIHLFTSEQVSLGRAAELAGYPLVNFQDLLRSLGIPFVVYDRDEYDRDQKAVELLRERATGEFTRLAAQAARDVQDPEPSEDEIVEAVRRTREEL